MSLDAIAPPFDIAALVNFALAVFIYASIMTEATPNYDPANSRLHAERTAGLIGVAAEHTNSGMRSFYHAIATIAWFSIRCCSCSRRHG